jgi:hypothetical protein
MIEGSGWEIIDLGWMWEPTNSSRPLRNTLEPYWDFQPF